MPKKKVKTQTFNGHRYRIDINRTNGLCDVHGDRKELKDFMVFVTPHTKKGLRIILHECLHAEDWDKSEEAVDRTSREISNFLWRLGYRLKKFD